MLSRFVTGTLFAMVAGLSAIDARPENPVPEQKADEKEETVASIEARCKRHDGFQSFYWDYPEGKIWLSIEDWDREFLFSYGLATGLGSNPVGLDRGQLGDELVCQFRRVGKKVFLTARNLDYRALSDNPLEQRAVRESFAESILWGGVVGAEDETKALVDVTSLMTRDLHGVVEKLKETGQGEFELDLSRSGVFIERCRVFPKNTELEATLTFSGEKPGPLVERVTPSPRNITLRQHLSFVELPDDEYRPREHHPRCASMFIRFSDYAAPISDPLQKRWILRHRLKKADPEAAVSRPVEPIIYYVDPGAPELIRDALIDGASWWNEAFEAAGFQDAFQVKVLPDDADPMDVRYNVIQWVHRSTRGWSYGGSVIDPRTGEIIKGHVTLGSLRVRQDRLLFETMTSGRRGTASCGIVGVTEDTTLAEIARTVDPVEVALARIRQLSAHEVGHTLGFVHNFAASTYDDRASVMDYPAPRVRIGDDGKLDLADAYGVGIGTWDKWSVEYAYREFSADQDERNQLSKIVQSAIDREMTFISDADARPASASHPYANLWDNGDDPVAELKHVMRVRKIALQNLKPELLRENDAASDLQQMLVPVYLHHRFQVDATAKMIGGVEYSYDTAGQKVPQTPVPDRMQVQAFQELLKTIDPEQLVIHDKLWKSIVPQPFSTHRNIERFKGNTFPVFDRESAARVASDMTIGNLLQPQRISRLAMLNASRDDVLDANGLVTELVDHVWRQPVARNNESAVSRVVKQSVVDHLLQLLAEPDTSVAARGAARQGIDRVKWYLESAMELTDSTERNFARNLFDQITRFQQRPYPNVELPEAMPAPPGSPIGDR